MPAASDLTPSAENYLKVVWGLGEWSSEPVTAGLLADRLGLRVSTVSDGVRKLTERGLLDHAPYGAIRLTEAGRTVAVSMVRRHRVIETFLVEMLGYGWDEVHEEADVLEHAVSDRLVERLHEVLGRPARDPHGDPIPSASGALDPPAAVALADAAAGGDVTVVRVSDDDPARLRDFAARGLVPGAVVHVPEDGPGDEVRVLLGGPGGPALALDPAAARAVWVQPA
ncbi:metal-dependent transcriptional regulator [Pseudokineococcus lusitanus]|uniref:Manganese transport regulator n=1 Tax=Pseudokineococcus lusitanus TaxID=763993 RepID=A0A3N1G9Y0_9ACTN|nr:metal-dependent transcriptional regulator [Pseudokineococcus lusitanus]ROP27050.1 DtxR family iron (metal) dependent repressor [Pseudokineococcus lusitanus]